MHSGWTLRIRGFYRDELLVRCFKNIGLVGGIEEVEEITLPLPQLINPSGRVVAEGVKAVEDYFYLIAQGERAR